MYIPSPLKACLYSVVSIALFVAFGTQSVATPYFRDITSVGTSAEMIGIGNIQGFSKHALVLLESPAGLSKAGNSFSGFYTSYFGDTQYMTGAVSHKLSSKFTVGLGTAYERSANLDITATNNSNEFVSTDTFSVDKLQVIPGVSYSPLKNLHIGTSWTFYKSNIYNIHGNGGDLALGILYETRFGNLILNGKNILGKKVNFNDLTSERLAAQWSIGGQSMKLPIIKSEVYGQLKQIQGVGEIAKSGGVRFYPLHNNTLSLSVGYNERPIITTLKRSVTAGILLDLESLWVAYTYDSTDVYQNNQQHYFSVGFRY